MRQRECPACGGRRLKPESLAVTVAGRNIHDLSSLSVRAGLAFFAGLELPRHPGGDRAPRSSRRSARAWSSWATSAWST